MPNGRPGPARSDQVSPVLRVYLHTFGCKANQYDTEVVRQRLEAAGCTIVEASGTADVAVVNSCTVTHVGEAKMRGLVRRLARRRPDIRTVVMGCAAAVDDGTLAALPGVVAVRGGAEPDAVLEALRLPIPAVRDGLLRRFARGTRAWLKIQDGCDEHCTFCATVVARGRNRSRPVEDLVAEARLLARYAEEIVLTGVHIGAYGNDGSDGRWSLGRLAEHLVRPSRMEIWVMNADGSDQRQLTNLGGANFAPYFHPDGRRILFASNHRDPRSRNFDLYLIDLDGSNLRQVTFDAAFDGFPMFSPDGTRLVFASNRHGAVPGETNIFIADWAEPAR